MLGEFVELGTVALRPAEPRRDFIDGLVGALQHPSFGPSFGASFGPSFCRHKLDGPMASGGLLMFVVSRGSLFMAKSHTVLIWSWLIIDPPDVPHDLTQPQIFAYIFAVVEGSI